jgi:DNA-binding IclR family transcriptional regulator
MFAVTSVLAPFDADADADAEVDIAIGKEPRASVLERVTLIMDLFDSGRDMLLLETVSDRTGLPRSTAFRLLRQLVGLGWLQHSSYGYQLGPRSLAIQSRAADNGLRSAAATVLNELNLKTGAVSHLGVLEGASVHYLDKIGGAAASSVPSRVGARIPANTTVTGRALLASLCPEDVDRMMLSGALKRAHSAQDIAELHAELSRIRQHHGVAYSCAEHCSMGISSLAAPVLGPDGAVGAISIAARRSLPLRRLAPLLVDAARYTSRQLFPHWSPAEGQVGRGRAHLTAL